MHPFKVSSRYFGHAPKYLSFFKPKSWWVFIMKTASLLAFTLCLVYVLIPTQNVAFGNGLGMSDNA